MHLRDQKQLRRARKTISENRSAQEMKARCNSKLCRAAHTFRLVAAFNNFVFSLGEDCLQAQKALITCKCVETCKQRAGHGLRPQTRNLRRDALGGSEMQSRASFVTQRVCSRMQSEPNAQCLSDLSAVCPGIALQDFKSSGKNALSRRRISRVSKSNRDDVRVRCGATSPSHRGGPAINYSARHTRLFNCDVTRRAFHCNSGRTSLGLRVASPRRLAPSLSGRVGKRVVEANV